MSQLGRVLIVGAAGQVGTELKRSFADAGDVICYDRAQVDLASEPQVRAMIRAAEPNLILNASAYTAVDRAESEPELAFAVNAEAPRILAEETSARNILLVHYSTDYVFDGSKNSPWTEADSPNPLNAYGRTKLAGEEAIRNVGGKFLIFRTSWVYGPHGKNFLFTMLRLGRERDQLSIVDDQIGAPTTSIELANATRTVVDKIASDNRPETWSGLYHMTCGGSASWCDFASAIFDEAAERHGSKKPHLQPIPSASYPTPARRPLNSVLSNEKLRDRFDIELSPWRQALKATFDQIDLSPN